LKATLFYCRLVLGEGVEIVMSIADSKTPNPEENARTSELREMLEREVAALPAAFRLVLVFRDVEKLSTAETAAYIDPSEDLVKTRLHRARAMLRDRVYRNAGVTLESIFAVDHSRCDRIVAAVMETISRLGDSPLT
jgi:RNA polymerase sigma-70 factor (ECF subfamily)